MNNKEQKVELLPSAQMEQNHLLGDVLSISQAKMVAITEGKKIKHRFYTADEFIEYKKGEWVTEDGYVLPVGYFESMNGDWLTGWSVHIA